MKKFFLLLVSIAVSIPQVCSRLAAGPDIVGSVIKIYSECYAYSYQAPWQLEGPESVTGSGCIVAGSPAALSSRMEYESAFYYVMDVLSVPKSEQEKMLSIAQH